MVTADRRFVQCLGGQAVTTHKMTLHYSYVLAHKLFMSCCFFCSCFIKLLIVILFGRMFRSREASKYHIQLSIAIFCMLLVFVAGVDKTSKYGGCVFVSTLLHYFSLAAVCWMGGEAILMFQKLVFIFKKITRRQIIITSLVCWSKLCSYNYHYFVTTTVQSLPEPRNI